MTAPGVCPGIGDQPGPYRIEMNVSYQGKYIGVRLHQQGLVPPLKQVVFPLLMSVHPPSIPKGKVVHDHGQEDVGNLDGKMHMIVIHHKAWTR